jgi:predicted PurR-regulated permease PerM
VFVISGVDNLLKPYLISRAGSLPFILVLLGAFGGVLAFGLIGVFLGPVLLALGFNLVLEWSGAAPIHHPEAMTQARESDRTTS